MSPPTSPVKQLPPRPEWAPRALGQLLRGGGVSVSPLAIGCSSFGRSVDARSVKAIVATALERGVNTFDTADVYGQPHGRSELLLGKALGRQRQRAVIATKFGFPLSSEPHSRLPVGHGASRYVMAAADASLMRLGTDYIDLLQIHVPDPLTPVDETLSAFENLVASGRVRSVGLSRYSAQQLKEASEASDVVSSVQVEYSLLCRAAEEDLLSTAEGLGVAVLTCLPLASGLLTGKYRESERPLGSRLAHAAFSSWYAAVPWAQLDAIRKFSERRSISMLSVALGYLLAQRAVTCVITGVTSAEQVRENIRACDWQPSSDDILELRQIVGRWPNFGARVPWERAGLW